MCFEMDWRNHFLPYFLHNPPSDKVRVAGMLVPHILFTEDGCDFFVHLFFSFSFFLSLRTHPNHHELLEVTENILERHKPTLSHP